VNSIEHNIPADKTVHKKRLKIPKWESESVYRRRTENTMAKKKTYRKRSTKHTNKTEDPVKRGLAQVLRKGGSFLFH
jgi:hypothetical protein